MLVADASASLLYIDPRFRLLLVLGVEGRLEQQGRLSYRMLQRVEGGMVGGRVHHDSAHGCFEHEHRHLPL